MPTLFQVLDDLGHEGVEVAGMPGRNDPIVHRHLLVDPTAARIDDVGTDGDVARDLTVLYGAVSTRRHGPWQIAATILPESTKALTVASAVSLMRKVSGFICPPGSTSAS